MLFARRINGLTSINLTKLDVLSEIETIKLATAYKLDGECITAVPSTIEALERVEVVYEELPGWKQDISKVGRGAQSKISALTERAKRVLEEGLAAGMHAYT